jgi:hypothetical protein
MSELEKSIIEMEELYFSKDMQNQNIIKSHIMEILLSFSNTPEFFSIMKKRDKFLKEIFLTIYDIPELSYKILLIMINLSSDREIADIMSEKETIKNLLDIIFKGMKKINQEHIKIDKSLLKEEKEEEKVSDFKIFTINEEKIKSTETDLLLEIESIKLAMLFMSNLIFYSDKAKMDLVDKEDQECNNLMIISDWMLNDNLTAVFENFLDILVNLSNFSDLRESLIKHLTKKFFKLFDFYLFHSEMKNLDKVYKVLRNLSFEQNNLPLFHGILNSDFFKNNLFIFKSQGISMSEKSEFAVYFIDIFASLYTSSCLESLEDKQKTFLFNNDFQQILFQLRCVNIAKADVIDRLEVLEHITREFLSVYDEKIQNEVD